MKISNYFSRFSISRHKLPRLRRLRDRQGEGRERQAADPGIDLAAAGLPRRYAGRLCGPRRVSAQDAKAAVHFRASHHRRNAGGGDRVWVGVDAGGLAPAAPPARLQLAGGLVEVPQQLADRLGLGQQDGICPHRGSFEQVAIEGIRHDECSVQHFVAVEVVDGGFRIICGHRRPLPRRRGRSNDAAIPGSARAMALAPPYFYRQ